MGLKEQFKACVRIIQNAVATCMIGDREAYQMVMDMSEITINCKSKLVHAYHINRRYIRDVGFVLSEIGGL
jgi:hypothetical protein